MSVVYQCIVKDKKSGKSKQMGSIQLNDENEKAELRFYGDIVSSSWESYYFQEDKCPQDIADFLAEIPKNKELDIYINSGGGNVHAGLAILQQLKRHEGKKTTRSDGLAASIAGVLLMAGDEIIMPKSSQLMMHKPWSRCLGNAEDMRKEADILDVCQRSILSIFMSKAREGIDEQTIQALIDKETWLTGEEAADYFDVIVEDAGIVMNCASQYFSSYKHMPQNMEEQGEKVEGGKPDYEKIVDMVIEKIKGKEQKTQSNEIEKQELWNELELF